MSEKLTGRKSLLPDIK